MTGARWHEVKTVFLDAVELSEPDRETFLRKLEPVDREISGMVRELLKAAEESLPDLRKPCWSLGAESEPAGIFTEGRVLANRFEITGFLGAGGLGQVYRAFDRQQQISVAIKTLYSGLLSDRSAASVLRNELNTARAVTHPNVCRLYDVHWSTGTGDPPFFTMELLEGQSLGEHLKTYGAFRADEAEPIVAQILDGLQAAHRQGIVHRDLKAGNILLTRSQMRVVLMDFGLARDLSATADTLATLTTNSFFGTPAYMAPEQLRGKPATFRSDIHALGVLMFEMVTGKKPFPGATPIEIASARLNRSAPSPREFTRTLPRRWEHTILECLQADPARRPSSAEAVREMLLREPPFLQVHRREFVFACAAAAAGGLGVGAYRYVHGLAGATGIAGIEVAEIENLTGDPALAGLCRGTSLEVARRLAKLPNVTVIPLPGSRSRSAPNQAHRFLFSGRLEQAPQALRLRVELTDRVAAKPIWSETFGRQKLDDAVLLQTAIAEGVTAQMGHHLALNGTVSSTGQVPTHTLALDAYTRARALLEETTPASTRAAAVYLRQAVAEDPGFALAWSALAETNLSLMSFVTGSSEALFNQARESAEQAVALDPKLAEAHLSRAAVRQAALDWEGAEASYREALGLKPSFSRAHRWYAGFVIQFGRFEQALEHARLAGTYDPDDQSVAMSTGLYLVFAGKPKDAIGILEPAARAKESDGMRNNLGQAYVRMAQLSTGGERQVWLNKALSQGQALARNEIRRNQKRPLLSDRLFALTYTVSGNFVAADMHLKRMREDSNNRLLSPADVSWSYAIRGKHAEALKLLNESYVLHQRSLLYIKVNPFLESLRGEAGFIELVRKLHL